MEVYERDMSKTKGKIVLSRGAFAAYAISCALVVVAVGLLVGLLGRPECDSCDVIVVNTTTAEQPTTTEVTSAAPPGPWTNIRLPPSLIPVHYDVDLQPVLQEDEEGRCWFNGTTSVTFMVAQSTDVVCIHSYKLDYDSVSLLDDEDNVVAITSHWTYEPNQYLIVEAGEELVVGGNYTLTTRFRGELANDLKGLYLSTYVNTARETVNIAVSQMQPTDARKAFPCFDEPALKATFDISLWHKDPNYALSNMPNISTQMMNDGWKRTKFARTLPMSTYLLAFVVSDFGFVESETGGNNSVQTRVYARAGEVANGNVDYAKNVTPTVLSYYNEYFDVLYPLPKSDQIAIPDFALGGMENWGLVMYRESALLYDDNINSASNKQRVAAIVAHELSHQWFGDLITPKWWDELWLNEGFATFIEYLGTDKIDPGFQIMDQFVVLDLRDAMAVDSLTTSRPIVAENVQTPDQINALFDDISYSKAGCVIRMINRFAGEQAFKTGLKNYLNEFAYGPVDHTNLFAFWEEAISNTPGASAPPGGFDDAMNTWVLQMGFPVVNMRRSAGDESVRLSQERFLLDPSADVTQPPSDLGYEWVIPLWYKEESSENGSMVWMSPNDGGVATISVPRNDYYIGNYEVFGYYRVNYDSENWERITLQLNTDHTEINVRNRGQLIDDAFALARAGKLTYDVALNLTKFLRNDLEYVPWESALDALSYLERVLGRSQVFGAYSSYLLYLVQPLYDSMSWNPVEDHLEKYQQVNALTVACGLGNESCIEEANSQFDAWRGNPSNNRISPDLRSLVYCTVVANGGAAEWDFVWETYLEESNPQERSKLQYALTCAKELWIVSRFLQFTLDTNYVRKQDASSIYENLCYNEQARDLTWDFVRQNWDYIYEVYGNGFFSFSGIIESCTSHFCTEFELKELQVFMETNADKLGSGLRAAEQAVEKTTTNIQWRADNEEFILSWFTSSLER